MVTQEEWPRTVMLVDDDKINNFLNERLLRKLGAFEHIHIFQDGESALAFLQKELELGKECPHLIFIDMNMPVINGIEFLETYHTLNFPNQDKVNLIGLTTSLRSSDIDKLKSLNCKYILNKPLTNSSLSSLLKNLLPSSKLNLEI
jgi:CheY-like chemotaxis protein